ncbi:MAG: hypothetical protein R3B84_03550 [Zavarzinella sp.]
MTDREFEDRDVLVAGLVDGELTAAESRDVILAIESSPALAEELANQRNFSRNSELWRLVAPPMPDAADWARVQHNVMPAPHGGALPRRWWVNGFAGLLAAAACVALWFAYSGETLQVRTGTYTVQADWEPIVMAQPEDIQILVLPESAVSALLVGEHPLQDEIPVFAQTADIKVLGYGDDNQLLNTNVWNPEDQSATPVLFRAWQGR